ncbi:MAG: hydroxymyristoyl-ACP dehydratase [Bacteroidetes bacterium]|nr:hydroxymyristoyl-ACP dehydratase [Bacteroidota bacterium]
MFQEILDRLPYKSSFRFVDEITALDTNGITGTYTLRKDSFFYEDHFPGNPVTPGVIITEIMAQIGLVSFGIYLLLQEKDLTNPNENKFPLFTSADVSFLKIVLPGEKLTVVSKKQYFRFNKLKCYIEITNEKAEMVARGFFSGILKNID